MEAYGVETVRKAITDPFDIQLVYGDAGYLDMMGHRIVEGSYPGEVHEIAADAQTLRNLGVEAKPGSQVTLDGETFTVSGILTKRFMFSRKGTFVGILLSLSIRSEIFLGAAYVTENIRINNDLTFKADDGLGSDI